jgi:glutaredoxin
VTTHLTLYSKAGCHLCEELRGLLDELQPEYGFLLEEIDITDDPTLFARYRHDIPVLLMGGHEIARGRISERDLVSLLEGNRP